MTKNDALLLLNLLKKKKKAASVDVYLLNMKYLRLLPSWAAYLFIYVLERTKISVVGKK